MASEATSTASIPCWNSSAPTWGPTMVVRKSSTGRASCCPSMVARSSAAQGSAWGGSLMSHSPGTPAPCSST